MRNCIHPARRIDQKSIVAFLLTIAHAVMAVGAFAASSPPVLTLMPASRVAFEGEQVTFRAAADGTTPIQYQWLANGRPVPGGAGPTLILNVTASQDQTAFSVVASNLLGQAASSNAVLTVKAGIVVAASVNESTHPVLRRGWPMFLDMGLLHPEMFDTNAEPILISSTNGSWPNALR